MLYDHAALLHSSIFLFIYIIRTVHVPPATQAGLSRVYHGLGAQLLLHYALYQDRRVRMITFKFNILALPNFQPAKRTLEEPDILGGPREP